MTTVGIAAVTVTIVTAAAGRTTAGPTVAAARAALRHRAAGSREASGRTDARHVEITVREGTNLAVAAARDGRFFILGLQGVLWRLEEGGAAAKPLTTWDVEAVGPTVSPDNRSVAFYAYRGGNFHIWMMAADGSGLKQLTDGPFDDREPAWSPDGSRLAFGSDRGGTGSNDIWTVDVRSGRLTQRTSAATEEFQPAWSPDGREIAFVDDGKVIAAIDEAGHRRVVASGDGGIVEAPSWSPAGILAYIQSDVRRRHPRLIVPGNAVTTTEDVFPFPVAWLTRDRYAYGADGHLRIRQINSDSVIDVPFEATISLDRPVYPHKPFPFDDQPHEVLGISQPRLSPDGTTVLFKALNDIWTMRIGAAPQRITADEYYESGLNWSRDGRQIVYSSDKAGTPDIYLRDAASGRERRVTSRPGAEFTPALSPDGRTVAFQTDAHEWWLANIASGATRKLIAGLSRELLGRPTWSPDSRYVAYADLVPVNGRFREGYLHIRSVDVETGKANAYAVAPHRTIADRGDSGPVWSPDGRWMAFIMEAVLWMVPVDATGKPTGPARQLTHESSDAPSWSGDSQRLLYLHNAKLQLVDLDGRQLSELRVPLTYRQQEPAGTTVIHAGRVWEGTGPTVRSNVDIVINRNRIERIVAHADANHRGARAIDASDDTVIPGLIETHQHPQYRGDEYGGRYGRLWLAYGITSVISMGGQAYEAVEGREAAWSGALVGPRDFETGQLFDGSRLSHPEVRAVTSAEQMRLELGRAEALKFDLLKGYVRLPGTLMAQLAAFGHQNLGVISVGHLLTPGIQAGFDGTSHFATQRLPFNWAESNNGVMYDDVRELLTRADYSVITGGSPAWIAEQPELASDARVRTLFPQNDEQAIQRFAKAGLSETQRQALMPAIVNYANLYRSGTAVSFGTDAPLVFPALSLHMVMRGFAETGGLHAWQVLEMATRLAARYIGADRDIGTLEAGKVADLAIIAGDPLSSFNDLVRVVGSMKNGRYYTVQELMQPYASKPN